MSMYYSPEIVRLLTEERLREAQGARLAHSARPHASGRSRFADPLRRLFGRRPAQATCTC
jgi:hypothetical protein